METRVVGLVGTGLGGIRRLAGEARSVLVPIVIDMNAIRRLLLHVTSPHSIAHPHDTPLGSGKGLDEDVEAFSSFPS